MAESPRGRSPMGAGVGQRSLLASLLTDHLDPGYAAAAARRRKHTPEPDPGDRAGPDGAAGPDGPDGPGGSARAHGASGSAGPASRLRSARLRSPRLGSGAWAAALLVAGVLFGVAVRSTADRAPAAVTTRNALLADIARAQSVESGLAAGRSSVAAQVRTEQSVLGAGGPAARLRALEQQGALTPVRGPGLSLTLDGATPGSGDGIILDRDVQVLVNGLWSAGAEAVALGGVRIGATTSIRHAGAALLVDDRAVTWPMTVQAVGNPAPLHVAFVRTLGYRRFASFGSLYGIRFDLAEVQDLELPGAADQPLRYATAAITPTAPTAPTGPTGSTAVTR